MKPSGQQKLVLLMSVNAVLWSLSHGCPIEPGPICEDELPNAILIISRLKKSLKDFNKALANEGIGGTTLTEPLCVGDIVDEPLDLDTQLCQYTKCFQHYASIVRNYRSGTLKLSVEYCQKYLNQLENIIKKMTEDSSTSCTTHCRISWSSTDRWHELTKGPHLAQELFAYLEQLNLSCS